ncbi:hypothetical protein [Streptomyces scabiei]|uniref:hypothetical protein n=1 Tax=Streptomyces scabiei TaxID=1930 RepID=UPI0029BDCED6|nr:hypothetical protein [Streptomyces scabiei]MDX3210759.1 hypothetical protein [Streptomyces scabiei]
MSPDHGYATARQMVDPDADYTVHIRTATGWTQPTDPDHRELPGLDVLLAARRVLRARPTGHVESTSPDTLDIRTGNGRLWLRFTDTTLGEYDSAPRRAGARRPHAGRTVAGPRPVGLRARTSRPLRPHDVGS